MMRAWSKVNARNGLCTWAARQLRRRGGAANTGSASTTPAASRPSRPSSGRSLGSRYPRSEEFPPIETRRAHARLGRHELPFRSPSCPQRRHRGFTWRSRCGYARRGPGAFRAQNKFRFGAIPCGERTPHAAEHRLRGRGGVHRRVTGARRRARHRARCADRARLGAPWPALTTPAATIRAHERCWEPPANHAPSSGSEVRAQRRGRGGWPTAASEWFCDAQKSTQTSIGTARRNGKRRDLKEQHRATTMRFKRFVKCSSALITDRLQKIS